MEVRKYLKARDMEVTPPKNTCVGRLSIDAEFKISGKRGVIVNPKRGAVSDRYLSLLSEDGVSFVVAEGSSILSFYETLKKGKNLVAVRALRPTKSHPFPIPAVLEHLSTLLRQAVKKQELAAQIASNIALVRIADEKNDRMDEWDNSISDSVEDCASLLKKITDQIKNSDINNERILEACAIIAGFRFVPKTQSESILLLDWLGRLSADRKNIQGLPLELSPIFQAISEKAQSVSIVTTAIGAQFSALSGKPDDIIFLENESHGTLPFLKNMYPCTPFATENYLEYRDDKFTDTVILIPPFGMHFSLNPKMTFASSFFKKKAASKKYPAEYLYIFKAIEQCQINGTIIAAVPEGILSGASHRAFRDWLLDTVQILGVVSLPAGFCFSGTAIRCSILLIKKAEPLPSDYSISMLEVRAEDFEAKAASGTIEAIKEMLQLEGHA